ncbi:MAG: head-tail connector protein [Hyphomonadaceae bacterium]
MSITLLTPPASEPVSLAEAKLFLRVEHDAEDDLIALMIQSAREAVEAGCGRALITRRVRESLDIWRADSIGGALLSVGPATNVVAVRLIAANGSESLIDAERYRLDGARDRPRLIFEAGLPTLLRSAGGVEVDYDAGLADAAADLPVGLRLAVLHVAATLFETRQGEARIPEAARALMAPYAPARL